jgi:hypothetical protein
MLIPEVFPGEEHRDPRVRAVFARSGEDGRGRDLRQAERIAGVFGAFERRSESIQREQRCDGLGALRGRYEARRQDYA